MAAAGARSWRGGAVAVVLAVLTALALGGGDWRPGARAADAQTGWRSVPEAACGPDDRVETGLQGQTTLAERFSGASEEAYTCNLELVGQYQGEGAAWQMAAYDDCAYYGTANHPDQARRGVVVVDASDPANPRPTAHLDDPAMLDPWESLKVNERRKLLGANKGPGGTDDRYFAFYDIADCDQPELLSVLELADHIGHAGDFAPDGRTYYGTSVTSPGHLTAVDITDPRNPRQILTTREFQLHDIALSDDGTRLYAARIGNAPPNFDQPNGLMVLDVSDVQARRPNPRIRVLGEVSWTDGSVAQVPQPVRINGKPYVVFVDERGSGRAAGRGRDGWAAACAQGLPPFGFARMIDISDERNPKVVSKLMLDVHHPANCDEVLEDNPQSSFAYDSHYCTVDDPRNAKLVGCGYFGSGLRVFDIRDPHNPREVAYYKPPAQRTAFLPGSYWWRTYPDRTVDWAASNVRFVRHEGELHIWFISQDNGFQIVRATNRLAALTGRAFTQAHPDNRR